MWERFREGLSRTRQSFTEQMNLLLDRGPDVDDDFWDGLEEALIMSDVGALTSANIVNRMQEEAKRKALPDAYAVMDVLSDRIADHFATTELNIFDENPVCVLFVGINGAGKTTTVGKIAYEAKSSGRNVLLGSADTFRAAAIEQLEVWANRADVEIVERERGSDPASVCYDTIERGEATGADMILIDTAGRLHTSADLMRELQKVVSVVRKRSAIPVRTVLVIDATTGQNGLSQAREFHKALDLDAVIITKLDGTARGGIALAVSSELKLPIAKVGVGEALEDLQDFDAQSFAAALIGAEPEDVDDRLPDVANEVNGQAVDDAAIEESSDEQVASVQDGACIAQDHRKEEDLSDLSEGIREEFEFIEGETADNRVEEAQLNSDLGDGQDQVETDMEKVPEEEKGVFKRLFRWAGRK